MNDRTTGRDTVIALCGGVGGAKLALGLQTIGLGNALAVIVNTGDDFEHLGLSICPDIDTVLYTLGGIADAARGWGRAGETWSFMAEWRALGGDDWFQLGDRDLATHILRTEALRSGRTLSGVTAELAHAFGVEARVLPMSDEPVRTCVRTDIGDLPFQRYFVQQRCKPVVREVVFAGADGARAAGGVTALLDTTATAAVVICPSNPYLSIDPILSVPGIRERLRDIDAPVVAVSPIIGGDAVKGPTAKIMRELGIGPSALSIAKHYHDLIDGLVIDNADAAERDAVEALGVAVHVTEAMMRDEADKARLAEEALGFAAQVRRSKRGTST